MPEPHPKDERRVRPPIPLTTAENRVSVPENCPTSIEDLCEINFLDAFGRAGRQPNSARQKRGWQRTGSGSQRPVSVLLKSAYRMTFLIDKIART
jgi:hypothetical protein